MKDDFDEKYEQIVHPGETKMERYMRLSKEFIEDLKERAVNNYEHIKVRFGHNIQNNNNEINIKEE